MDDKEQPSPGSDEQFEDQRASPLGRDGSRRPARPPRRPPAPPLRVRIELVVVDGPEGRYLRQRQADAMRAALRWLADNRASPAGTQS